LLIVFIVYLLVNLNETNRNKLNLFNQFG